MNYSFDLTGGSQGAAATEHLARQFGLSLEQAQRAVQTLLPAFALGLQRSAADPGALARLFGALGSGPHTGFYDSPSAPSEAHQTGAELLGQIFGSPELTRRIAEQAAAMTGIGMEMMARMMPAMAALLMGDPARPGAPGTDRAGSVLPDFNPWLAMMAGTGGAAAPPRPGPGAPGPDPFEIWRGLFETGREVQERQVAAVRNIFDTFWGAPRESPEPEQDAPQAGTGSRRPPK